MIRFDLFNNKTKTNQLTFWKAFPFVRRGLAPEGCSTTLLWRLVGQTRALDWVLTGRLFDAQSVANSGLFTLCVPRDQVLPKALEYVINLHYLYFIVVLMWNDLFKKITKANMIVSQCSPTMSVLARALMWQGLNNDTHVILDLLFFWQHNIVEWK